MYILLLGLLVLAHASVPTPHTHLTVLGRSRGSSLLETTSPIDSAQESGALQFTIPLSVTPSISLSIVLSGSSMLSGNTLATELSFAAKASVGVKVFSFGLAVTGSLILEVEVLKAKEGDTPMKAALRLIKEIVMKAYHKFRGPPSPEQLKAEVEAMRKNVGNFPDFYTGDTTMLETSGATWRFTEDGIRVISQLYHDFLRGVLIECDKRDDLNILCQMKDIDVWLAFQPVFLLHYTSGRGDLRGELDCDKYKNKATDESEKNKDFFRYALCKMGTHKSAKKAKFVEEFIPLVLGDAVNVFLKEMQIYRSSFLERHGQARHRMQRQGSFDVGTGEAIKTDEYKLAQLNTHRQENAIVPTYLLALFGDINRLLDMIKAMEIPEEQFGFRGLTVPMTVTGSVTAGISKVHSITAQVFAGASWEILALPPYIKRVGLSFGASLAMGDGNGIGWLRQSFTDPSKVTTYTITASLRVSPSDAVSAHLADPVVSDLLKDFIFNIIVGDKCGHFGSIYKTVQEQLAPLAPESSSTAEKVEPATVKENALAMMGTVQKYLKGKIEGWEAYLQQKAKGEVEGVAKNAAKDAIMALFGTEIKAIWNKLPKDALLPVSSSKSVGFDLTWGKSAGEPWAMQSIAWVVSSGKVMKVPGCDECPQVSLASGAALTETCDFTEAE